MVIGIVNRLLLYILTDSTVVPAILVRVVFVISADCALLSVLESDKLYGNTSY